MCFWCDDYEDPLRVNGLILRLIGPVLCVGGGV